MIVGFCGPIGAGKSAAAERLVEQHGFVRLRFAQPLKEALAGLLASAGACPDEIARMIDGDLKEHPAPFLAGRTPRHAMQTLGTEWGRNCIGGDYWVSLWKARARASLDAGLNVVADDVRFPNEAEAIRALGGPVVRIERAGPVASDHASEKQCVAFDRSIRNDEGLDDLFRIVDGLARDCSWASAYWHRAGARAD